MAHLKTISWTLAVLLTAVSAGAIAQVNPTLTETERGIRNGKPEAAAHLRIDEVELDVHVVGKTADITLELLIGSDTNTWHEANLALTLPADAVVTGYALDIEGKLIPGQLGPNRFHQKRTVSWHMSMPRSNSRSSTFRSDSGNCTYMSTTSRITSGDERNPRNGLGGLVLDFRFIRCRYHGVPPPAARI